MNTDCTLKVGHTDDDLVILSIEPNDGSEGVAVELDYEQVMRLCTVVLGEFNEDS